MQRETYTIEFEPEDHIYRVGGIVKPNVTTVLEAGGLSDFTGVPARIMKYARDRGSAVHLAAWYDDQNDLAHSTVDPRIIGYVRAWRAFRRRTQFTIAEGGIERRLYCPVYDYCGTLDRIGSLVWTHGPVNAIVDIKTGVESESHAPQLAAYAQAVGKPRMWWRFAVMLRATGDYSIRAFPPSSWDAEFNTFRRCLHQWQAQNRLNVTARLTKV